SGLSGSLYAVRIDSEHRISLPQKPRYKIGVTITATPIQQQTLFNLDTKAALGHLPYGGCPK
ncbi:MAG: hypothetical protein IIZ11_00630, partial [Erysipelotrichaceae bacterium]|nr:hypothetical protein [Erysipelotrichaceae bacterium]